MGSESWAHWGEFKWQLGRRVAVETSLAFCHPMPKLPLEFVWVRTPNFGALGSQSQWRLEDRNASGITPRSHVNREPFHCR